MTNNQLFEQANNILWRMRESIEEDLIITYHEYIDYEHSSEVISCEE